MAYPVGPGDQIFTIGRDKSCDIPIADDSVSRVHATLRAHAGGQWSLSDRQSANGTSVMRNGKFQRIDEAYVALPDHVQFGSVVLAVSALVEAISEKHARTRMPPASTTVNTPVRQIPVWHVIAAKFEGRWQGALLAVLLVSALLLLWKGDESSQSFKFVIGILGSLIASLSFVLLQRFWERK